MKRSLVVLAVSLGLTLGACGSGGSGGGRLTAAQLSDALLTVEDLPGGFERSKIGDGDFGFDQGDDGCKAVVQNLLALGRSSVEKTAAFSTMTKPTQVEERLATEDAGTAKDVFSTARGGLDDCDEFTYGTGEQAIDLSVAETQVESLGDETVSFRMQFTTEGLTLVLNAIAARVGDTRVVLTATGFKGQTMKLPAVEELAAKAVEKAEQAG